MLENIIVILLIIGFSYLFRENSSESTFNTQMLFILLSLGGIVFYKIIYLKQTMKNKEMYIVNATEGFKQNEGSLADVLGSFKGEGSSSNTEDVSNEENQQHRVTELEGIVMRLSDQLNTITKNKNNVGLLGNSMDLDNMESINQNELFRLEKEIEDLLTKTINNKKKEYKKIPIYNSCIIQEANNDETVVPEHTHAITDTKQFTDEEKNDIEKNIKNLQSYKEILTTIKPEIENIFKGITIDMDDTLV
jgi:hypothetical protein